MLQATRRSPDTASSQYRIVNQSLKTIPLFLTLVRICQVIFTRPKLPTNKDFRRSSGTFQKLTDKIIMPVFYVPPKLQNIEELHLSLNILKHVCDKYGVYLDCMQMQRPCEDDLLSIPSDLTNVRKTGMFFI